MSDSKIIKTIFLAATPETVWSYLIDKDKLSEWFFRADADLAPGKDYELLDKSSDETDVRKCWGTVLEMNPPSSLVYSFTIEPLGGGMTTVSWTLEAVAGGTRLTLEHDGIAEAAGAGALGLLMALEAGWDRHLGGLRTATR